MSRFNRQGRAPQSTPGTDPSQMTCPPGELAAENAAGAVGHEIHIDDTIVDEQPVRAPTKFRIGKDARISWHGQMTYLQGGQVLDSSGYGGAVGVKRLLEQGVVLIPLE